MRLDTIHGRKVKVLRDIFTSIKLDELHGQR